MNKITLYITLVLLFIFNAEVIAEIDWEKANKNVLRVNIENYSELPQDNIFIKLGCFVPQVGLVNYSGNYPRVKPYTMNVISGEFAKKGQKDWAVLCSRNKISTILLMWGGETKCPSELASTPDKNFLQSYGGNSVLYSRSIAISDSNEIYQQHKNWGGTTPPSQIDHDGINDIFESKASVIYYCQKGKWLKLSGYD